MQRGWLSALLAVAVVLLVVLFLGVAIGVLAFVAIAAPFVFVHARRPARGAEALPESAVAVPVRVPDEPSLTELDVITRLDGPVSCCPRCAYLGVRMPGIRDGLWPGGGETGARFVCPRCAFQGIPVEFDDADAYGDFVRALQVA